MTQVLLCIVIAFQVSILGNVVSRDERRDDIAWAEIVRTFLGGVVLYAFMRGLLLAYDTLFGAG